MEVIRNVMWLDSTIERIRQEIGKLEEELGEITRKNRKLQEEIRLLEIQRSVADPWAVMEEEAAKLVGLAVTQEMESIQLLLGNRHKEEEAYQRQLEMRTDEEARIRETLRIALAAIEDTIRDYAAPDRTDSPDMDHGSV